MRAEIIAVGTEITTGDTLNTNSQFISKELFDIGIEVYYHSSVDDNISRLGFTYRQAIDRSDIIVITGGLGPTEDDFTKELLAKILNLDLYYDKNCEKILYEKFKGREIPKNNFKQCWNIKGGKFIKNSVGTAPGIFLEYNKKKIILLPGPPRELEPMFINEVLPLLKEENFNLISKSINISGLGESLIELKIRDLRKKYENIEIATFGKIKNVQIRIIGRGKDKSDILKKIYNIQKEIENRFTDYIYSYDDESIDEVVFTMLKENKLKISFAESCTGGLAVSKFVRLPGASEVLDRGYITYSNLAKVEELGVKKDTLDNFGAVSYETCKEMCQGALKNSNADIGLAITGIVGPQSDNTNKPVGLIFIGIAYRNDVEVKEYRLNGSRIHMQDRIVENAYFFLRDFLRKNID